LQGVEHFFLYDNKSSDDYLAVLQPYILEGDVTLTDWSYTYQPKVEKRESTPWLAIQTKAYTDCIKKYAKSSQWMAFIDIDEFLFCPSGKRLPVFLKGYEEYAGLCVNWLLFGTSDLPSLPAGTLLVESLVRCAPRDEKRNRMIKSIVQPKYTERARSAHNFKYKKGYFAINPLRDQIDGIFSPRPSYDFIRINHYWTRTEDYFANRKITSRGKRRIYEDEAYLRKLSKNYNESTDAAILQFMPLLREKMMSIQQSRD